MNMLLQHGYIVVLYIVSLSSPLLCKHWWLRCWLKKQKNSPCYHTCYICGISVEALYDTHFVCTSCIRASFYPQKCPFLMPVPPCKMIVFESLEEKKVQRYPSTKQGFSSHNSSIWWSNNLHTQILYLWILLPFLVSCLAHQSLMCTEVHALKIFCYDYNNYDCVYYWQQWMQGALDALSAITLKPRKMCFVCTDLTWTCSRKYM